MTNEEPSKINPISHVTEATTARWLACHVQQREVEFLGWSVIFLLFPQRNPSRACLQCVRCRVVRQCITLL